MASDPMALANALDPSLYQQQLQAAQQQQLATLLMQQGLAPMGGTESVGGVAIRRSPMEGAAKLAALLSGQSLQGQANEKAAALMQGQSAAMRAAFGMGDAPQAPQGGQGPALGAVMAGQPVPGQQPQQAPQAGSATPAGTMGLPGMSPMQAMGSYFMSPDKYMESYLKGFTPNDTTIQARQGGVDPVVANRLALIKSSTDPKILGMQQAGMSPEQVYLAIFGEAAKNAEIDRKVNNQFANPLLNQYGQTPKLPENANPVGSPLPNGALPGVASIPGSSGVMAANSAATAAGTNTQTPETGYVNGQPVNTTRAARVQSAVPPAVQAGRDADAKLILQREIANETDPVAKGALTRELATRFPNVAPEQAPGVVKTADNATNTMNESYKTVATANAPAQTIQARLSAIGGLAKVAITGGDTEWRDQANNLLQLSGISERAVDRKSAGDLLDKNAAQIALAIGAGPSSTDSLRTLASAANPNRHMTPQAAQEAVDQLSASAKVQQAKAKVLTPMYNAGKPAEYLAAEQKFDAAGDYRLWQLHAMPAAQAKAFLSKLSPAEQASLRSKAAELKQLGAF